MYIPIVLGGILYGARGGLLIGLLAGITLGPFMPLNTVTGEMQSTVNWLFRTGFFSLIGLLVGFFYNSIYKYLIDIQWNAQHDEITNLPNRFALEKALNSLNATGNKSESHYLIVILLKNSEEIEMSFGIDAISAINKQLTDRIKNVFGNNTVVYSLHFNQISILLKETNENYLVQKTTELKTAVKESFDFQNFQLHCDVFLGIVAFKSVKEKPSYYFHQANMIVKEAANTNNQKHKISVTDETEKDVSEKLKLMGDLKEALDAKQLAMHYQPKIETNTGYIYGAEALMRWNHSVRGNIPPLEFIPRAEESTLINNLTFFAIDESLKQLAKWHNQGFRSKYVSVNISTHNLDEPDFTKVVNDLLDKHKINGKYLELEITETSFMQDISKTIEELSRLTQTNTVLSIDDFGTGYSSLKYLEQLPVSIIKIDKSFVQSLPSNTKAGNIVESIVGLSHKLGINVVAEGVENRETFDFLRNIGCDFAQGYYMCKPIPSVELEELIYKTDGQFVKV